MYGAITGEEAYSIGNVLGALAKGLIFSFASAVVGEALGALPSAKELSSQMTFGRIVKDAFGFTDTGKLLEIAAQVIPVIVEAIFPNSILAKIAGGLVGGLFHSLAMQNQVPGQGALDTARMDLFGTGANLMGSLVEGVVRFVGDFLADLADKWIYSHVRDENGNIVNLGMGGTDLFRAVAQGLARNLGQDVTKSLGAAVFLENANKLLPDIALKIANGSNNTMTQQQVLEKFQPHTQDPVLLFNLLGNIAQPGFVDKLGVHQGVFNQRVGAEITFENTLDITLMRGQGWVNTFLAPEWQGGQSAYEITSYQLDKALLKENKSIHDISLMAMRLNDQTIGQVLQGKFNLGNYLGNGLTLFENGTSLNHGYNRDEIIDTLLYRTQIHVMLAIDRYNTGALNSQDIVNALNNVVAARTQFGASTSDKALLGLVLGSSLASWNRLAVNMLHAAPGTVSFADMLTRGFAAFGKEGISITATEFFELSFSVRDEHLFDFMAAHGQAGMANRESFLTILKAANAARQADSTLRVSNLNLSTLILRATTPAINALLNGISMDNGQIRNFSDVIKNGMAAMLKGTSLSSNQVFEMLFSSSTTDILRVMAAYDVNKAGSNELDRLITHVRAARDTQIKGVDVRSGVADGQRGTLQAI